MAAQKEKTTTESPPRKNPVRETREKSNVDIPQNMSTLFDLRTTYGQLLFLLITISVSLLIQLLPNDALKTFISNRATDASATSVDHSQPVCNLSAPITSSAPKSPSYWFYGRNEGESHLKHVRNVLERLGFQKGTNETLDWDLLWAHDYPYRALYPRLHQLKPHQRVNHFPGCGFITNKVDLATTDLKYIPKAFKLPAEREKFVTYAEQNTQKLFVQKHNQHRHISIKSLSEIEFDKNETFLQEYVDKPLLVDGHKFDIGVYVIVTSVDPLRVYIYKGDVLFRFCPVKYYPFDAANVDKYIVGDDYLPTWDVPSLAPFYNGLGFGMKDSFDAYVKSKGRDPSIIWTQVEDAIRMTILSKEKHLVEALKYYRNKRNFFEMMRFDLIIDDDLKVHLMEANMSPNLSSAHYLQNTLLYEQVIFNLLNLVGVASSLQRESLRKRTSDIEQMVSSDKNIAVFANQCADPKCAESCESAECELCRPCLSTQDISDLHTAYREHTNRGDTKRIFPKPIESSQSPLTEVDLSGLSAKNRMITKWFVGKCAVDRTWCA